MEDYIYQKPLSGFNIGVVFGSFAPLHQGHLDDINYNPALGTGQIQIKDIHYVTYQYRTTWEMCQLLDKKYLKSSRRTIEDFYREAIKNKWIKE